MCNELTCFLHGVLEVGEVIALGDPEVPVGVLVLRDAVRWVRRTDGEHARGAVGALFPPELVGLRRRWRARAAVSERRRR